MSKLSIESDIRDCDTVLMKTETLNLVQSNRLFIRPQWILRTAVVHA